MWRISSKKDERWQRLLIGDWQYYNPVVWRSWPSGFRLCVKRQFTSQNCICVMTKTETIAMLINIQWGITPGGHSSGFYPVAPSGSQVSATASLWHGLLYESTLGVLRAKTLCPKLSTKILHILSCLAKTECVIQMYDWSWFELENRLGSCSFSWHEKWLRWTCFACFELWFCGSITCGSIKFIQSQNLTNAELDHAIYNHIFKSGFHNLDQKRFLSTTKIPINFDPDCYWLQFYFWFETYL